MKINLIKKIFIIFFLFFYSENLIAEVKNSIIITVGNQPITRHDLIKEIKYISIFSNIEINKSNNEKIKNLAIQSLVRRAIKSNEIERLKITEYNAADLEKQISRIYNNLNLTRENFKIFLKQKNLNFEDLIKNFETDLKWNTAIFKLYKNKISLNTIEIENKINTEVEKLKENKSLLLAEIQVNISSEGLEYTSNKVLKKIKEIGFDKTANELSISSSAANGGKLGWINENKISKQIYQNINTLKKGEISNPISMDGILIFIKIIDERNVAYNLEVIKKNIVNEEKMKKLEMFSNSHYSDLEKKTKVKFL